MLTWIVIAGGVASAVGCTVIHSRWRWRYRSAGLTAGQFYATTTRPPLRPMRVFTPEERAYLRGVHAGNLAIIAAHILAVLVVILETA